MNAEGFWRRVRKTNTCWIWEGSHTAGGYGNVRWEGRNDYAHRISYRQYKGPIASGLQIDHLCRNRSCVNPEHLEAVTHAENVRRGAGPYLAVRTTCKHGHDISDAANVYTEPSGHRRCRRCASIRESARVRRTAVSS